MRSEWLWNKPGADEPALGGEVILGYIASMSRAPPLLTGLLGVVFLAYWLTPAGTAFTVFSVATPPVARASAVGQFADELPCDRRRVIAIALPRRLP